MALDRKYRTTTPPEILVDEEDRPLIESRVWSVVDMGHTRYAKGRSHGELQVAPGKTIYLHRVILNARAGQSVDHINGNGEAL